MTRTVQQPTESVGGVNGGGTRLSHPAFGQIAAIRVSGRTALYGTDFIHNGFVAIRISRSVLDRDLSHDWPLAQEQLIEVYVSEAQWATFVSAMNVGEGALCTIQHVGREHMPQLPDPKDTSGQFKAEADEDLADALRRIAELEQMILDPAAKMPASLRKALASKAASVKSALNSSLPFVAESFARHMGKHVEKAKQEVSAWATRLIMRTGLDRLTNDRPLELPPPKDEAP